MQDTKGRSYAKMSDLRQGDRVEADAGFTCLHAGEIAQVHRDDAGDLFIPCADIGGRHGLDGQIADEDGDSLVGLYPA